MDKRKLPKVAKSPPKREGKRRKLSKDAEEDATEPEQSDMVCQWVISQQGINYNANDSAIDEELHSASQMVEDEPEEVPQDTEVPLRQVLKDKQQLDVMYIAPYECEWGKCQYSTSNDTEYYEHVHRHGRQYVQSQEGPLECGWSLCNFKSADATFLESHIHFHAYHTRLKSHGASLFTAVSVPACRHDSRTRNRIEQYKIQFKCEWENCNDEIYLAAIFFNHVQNHIISQFPVGSKSSSRWLSCKWGNCKQQYKRQSIAQEHARSHSTERTIGCPMCGAMFVARLKYLDHCKRQASFNIRKHRCPKCQRFYATKQILQDHLHMHERKYECPYCPMMMQSTTVLTEHIRNRHIALKPAQCTECSYRGTSMHALDEHMLTHLPQPIFYCEEFGCNASFRSEKTLKQHLNLVHYGIDSATYACHICTEQFRQTRRLTSHLLQVHKLQRPPGHVRFLYKECVDGLYRMVEPEISTSSRVMLEPVTPDDDTVGSTHTKNPVKVVIDKMERTNDRAVAIELKFGDPDSKPEVEPVNDVEPDPSGFMVPKHIDEFTVMKRYIKQEKPILITYEETDSVGSIVHSETYASAEINLCNGGELSAQPPSQ